ncbi:alternative ribosome rescue aminoacyl-tRNA hydrolase ArfB [Woeseia oceani]|uniref:Class I peptide chain release factor n=1 Tax=Woeseia oceani TaxID=1548547 RepID=A0A193LFJ0_9GAMM|nr:alternative ribosome rescue aminoacyl-tRNA hydrolase ArfB [Woeseia oceani]ANO51272.1 class I peptide chain release factor [Woeseia oceani]
MTGPLEITPEIVIPLSELEMNAIRAQGSGGQNVNKVSSAIHLRFDSQLSAALPDKLKERLLQISDQRVGKDGVIVIKAQRHRTQEQNRREAMERLRELLLPLLHTPRPRKPTRPSRRAVQQRINEKVHRGKVKQTRGPVHDD